MTAVQDDLVPEALVDEAGLQKQEDLRKMIESCHSVMNIVSEYEDTRPSAMSFIKLEEALLWIQVMVQTTNRRPENKVA